MTGPPASVTESSPLRQAGRGIGRAAALIGGITVVARVVGFGRQLVFAHTVGSHCLGTAYATANQVPNIIYDIVLGGALTSAIVPVLAGAAARRSAYRPVAKRPTGDGPTGERGRPETPPARPETPPARPETAPDRASPPAPTPKPPRSPRRC